MKSFKFKKLLAVILSVIMILSVVPISSFTAVADKRSGMCGINLTWLFDSDTGTLIINGTGEMANFLNFNPWASIKGQIKSIEMQEGVTSIGYFAFDWCTELEKISIPDSVTSIEGNAFSHCSKLKNITIPDSVTFISFSAFDDTEYYNNEANWEGDVLYICNNLIKAKTVISGLYNIKTNTKTIASQAFYGCTELTSITIPDSVTSICGSAFYGCTGLTSITIPDSATSIDSSAFYNTAWYNNQPDGLIYAGKVAYKYKGTCPASVDVRDGTVSITNSAFYNCTGLTSITIPDSVASIGEYAFSGCTGLTSVTIPNSVTLIGLNAFQGCTGLTSVTIPDSLTLIDEFAFFDCENLTDVYYTGTEQQKDAIQIDNEWEGNNGLLNATWHYNYVPENQKDIFEYEILDNEATITGLVDENTAGAIQIPSTIGGYPVTSIGGWAFSYCTGLTSVTIPDSVTSIGSYAFYDTAWYNNQPDGLVYAGKVAYKYKGTCPASVVIKDGTVGIAGDAFYNCTGLTSVTIPDSVTSIGEYAFSGCTGLTSVTIPDSVTSIGERAFYGCTALEYAIISNNTISIENAAFGDYRNYVTVYFTFGREEDNTLIGNYNYVLRRYNYNIKELLVNDVTVIEGTSVSLRTDGEGNNYFSYDIHPEYTIVLDDGRRITSSSTYTYIDDTNYSFEIRDNLNTDNFLPGNTYTLTGDFGGKNCEFNLTIEPTPVEKIELVENSKKYFVENYGGHFTKDRVGEEYYYYEIQGIDFWSSAGDDFDDAVFKITYKDGSYKTTSIKDSIEGEKIRWINNQAVDHWQPGENDTQVYFMGVTGILPVTVIEDPVQSLELVSGTSIKYLENVGGYLETWGGNYFSYYTQKPNDAKIRINYKDGTIKVANVGDNVNGFYIEWESNQPWSVGENDSTITYLNHEVNLPITVISGDDIENIEATLDFEFVEGYTNNSHYQIPYNLLNVTVNYKDGTSETKPIRHWKYMTVDDNQEENPWFVGDNYITVHYGKHSCDLKIIVKPSSSFADEHPSTVLMNDKIRLNWLTEDEFLESNPDFYNDVYPEDPNGPYATVLSMDDEQLCNIAKQFFDISNLDVIERFKIDNTAFVSFLDGDKWSNEIFIIKTTDDKNFEKVTLPADMGNFNAYWESRVWKLKKYKDTYVLAGLSYKIGKELFYYTSRDLITWQKHTFSIDDRTYCSNLSFAGITENGVYFLVKKYNSDPIVVDSWLGWDIYYTSDFENIKCITESFEDYTYYDTHTYKDYLSSSDSNNMAFIAFHYYHNNIEECNPSNIDNVKLCSYNENTGKVTVIESVDSQPTHWWVKLAGSDPRWYASNFGNICYTFSANNSNIIQTAILPFDVDDIRTCWEADFELNDKTYHLSISITSNEMYVSGDYWRTAYIIELPKEVAELDIESMPSEERIELFKNEKERYFSVNGTNGSYYFDFTPIKNILTGIHCEHKTTVVKNAKKATCTENGYTGDTVCNDCGEIIKQGEVISALGHNGEWKTVTKATLTEKGLKQEICKRCGKVLNEEEIPALGVTYDIESATTNAAESISVAVSDESNLPVTVEVKAEKTSVSEKQTTYEIHLENNGVEVQPLSPVLVKLPIPEGFDRDKLNIYRKEADGSKTRMNYIIDGDYAYFETDHFSIYEIIEKLCGDINGDGNVNNKDLTRLFQYLSEWDVELNAAALDVNGDSSTNNKDLTRLFQYLSEWDVEIF